MKIWSMILNVLVRNTRWAKDVKVNFHHKNLLLQILNVLKFLSVNLEESSAIHLNNLCVYFCDSDWLWRSSGGNIGAADPWSSILGSSSVWIT